VKSGASRQGLDTTPAYFTITMLGCGKMPEMASELLLP
jgi:hypothetical protein